MNHMERMVAALSHKEADRVPVYPLTSGVSRAITGVPYSVWSSDAQACADALLAAQKELDQDCIVSLVDLSIECDAWGQEIVYSDTEAAHPNYGNQLIKDIEGYDSIEKVDFRTSKRMMMHLDVCKRLVEAADSEFPVVAFVFGPLGTLSMLRGQQDMYMDIYDDPDAIKRAAFAIKETLKEYCGALIDEGVAAIMFDTLFASGSVMSKEMWDDLEGDLIQDLSEFVHARGAMVMIHNCGDKIYFDAQIRRMHPEAISFLFPPDDCADLRECKRKYGDVTTLIGAVDPTKACIGPDEAWQQECRDCIDDMKAGGGFVLATGCEYPSDASLERAHEMVKLAKTYGRY